MENKKSRFPLHIQIILSLIIGAAFGAYFAVSQDTLLIAFKSGGEQHEKEISAWENIEFIYQKETATLKKAGPEGRQVKEIILAEQHDSFGPDAQVAIIKAFEALSPEERESLSIKIGLKSGDIEEIRSAQSIRKKGTVATFIKPLGTLFINLLSFLAIPLVIASLIVGAASLEDIRKLGRIGGKTFAIYISTTAVAITIGLACANIIAPGERIDDSSKERLIGEYQAESSDKIVQKLDVDVLDFLVSIVPKNPVRAMADGNMLQIVFFAVIFGVTLTFIEKKKNEAVLNFFSGVSDTMIKMVDFIMKIAPLGVFALIAATIAEFGFDIIGTLIWYILAVILGLLLQTMLIYTLLVKFFGRMSPIKYFRGIRTAQVIGFSTSSSAATLPITFECAEQNLGLPKHITGFVLPLGATINMDGTALYQGVAAVFIAQVYGFDLNIVQQLTIVFTAVLASIGTAPVPGVGIIMLVMILQAIHVPPEGIALILGVDRILDMCRTITNVSGDAAVAVAVAGSEQARLKRKNKKA